MKAEMNIHKEKQMANFRKWTLVFLAALALVLVAAATHHPGAGIIGLVFLFGTATVTYTYPVQGTTPPTTAQIGGINPVDTVRAFVFMGDLDTTATLTHNFNESTTALAQGFPDVSISPVLFTAGPTETAPPMVSYTSAANALTFTKVSAVASACTWLVRVGRPSSLGN